MASGKSSLKGRALQWLAQREHSRLELRRKLLRAARHAAATVPASAQLTPLDEADGPSEPSPDEDEAPTRGPRRASAEAAAEVDAVLAWLEAGGYLSEARFVESRIHARQAGFGNLRIRLELRQHGLSLSADAHQALQQTEEQRARALWQRRFPAPAADALARQRQMRFLMARGFSPEVVQRVLRDGRRSDDDDLDAQLSSLAAGLDAD